MVQFFFFNKNAGNGQFFTFKNSELCWIDDMAEGLNSSPQEQGGKPPQGVGTAC